MLTTEQINDLHRLYWSEHWPIRKIERHLNMGWKTIRKYLDARAQGPVHRDRPSKLDPFNSAVAEWLEKDPGVSAAVIEQKLRAAGYLEVTASGVSTCVMCAHTLLSNGLSSAWNRWPEKDSRSLRTLRRTLLLGR